MGKTPHTECCLQILLLAEREGNNELLLRVVNSLAYCTTKLCGADALQCMKHVVVVNDDRGNIDKLDLKMRSSLMWAGMELITLIQEAELEDGHVLPEDRKRVPALMKQGRGEANG